MTQSADLVRDYRVAFLSYLHGRREAGRHRGYLLGRAAVDEGSGLLELARAHHDVFLEVLRDTPAEELPELVSAAAEFFLEVLAPAEMAQRGRSEQVEAARKAGGPRPGPGGSPAEVLSGSASERGRRKAAASERAVSLPPARP
jgi:hypothetical protein